MSYSYQKSFNAAQHALAKSQRGAAKLAIAQQDKSQTGTASYRAAHIPDTTLHSPVPGRPWK
jgi:hypothetical protein